MSAITGERGVFENGKRVWREIELPIPRWWRLFRNVFWRFPRVVGLGNRLYEWRYGFYAPCIMDCLKGETLHALSPSVYANWTANK